jgi:plastocyanin
MLQKLLLAITVTFTAAALSACGAASSGSSATRVADVASLGNPSSAALTITHVQIGCHAWMLQGGATAPTADIYLAPGGTLTVTDNDVMPHTLIGSGAAISGARMDHMGATAKVRFGPPGTYTFTTRAGEDYSAGVTTIGDDNNLQLTVIVA